MLCFGMPTLIEHNTLEESASLCRELGLQFIELNMNLPQYQLHTMDPNYLQRTAAQYGISYTLHLDENLNFSDFNPLVAEAYLRTVLESIDLAKKLHIPTLNMHLSRGVYFTLPNEKVFLFDRYRSVYLKSMENFRDRCTEVIGDSSIRICIENSSGYTPVQIEALDILLQSPVFGLTLDVGHDHCTGGNDSKLILDRSNRLYHIHLHDANDKKDHLVLGTGQVDLHRWLDFAKKNNCSVVIETKTIAGLRTSVKWLKNQKEET